MKELLEKQFFAAIIGGENYFEYPKKVTIEEIKNFDEEIFYIQDNENLMPFFISIQNNLIGKIDVQNGVRLNDIYQKIKVGDDTVYILSADVEFNSEEHQKYLSALNKYNVILIETDKIEPKTISKLFNVIVNSINMIAKDFNLLPLVYHVPIILDNNKMVEKIKKYNAVIQEYIETALTSKEHLNKLNDIINRLKNAEKDFYQIFLDVLKKH